MSPAMSMSLLGANRPAICFRQNCTKELSYAAPRTSPFTAGARSRRGLITKARRRAARQEEPEEEEEVTESRTGLFSGLFGNRTGTQRLKAGQDDEEQPTPPKAKRASPGGFLQTARIARKDQNTVFVAGATGRLGLRIVRELLLAGFKVRAGARDTEKAQSYVESAVSLGVLTSDAAKRLQIVPVDLEDPGSISAALGTATRVVQAIGAAENNVLDFGAPKRIDNKAAVALVNASVEAGVTQYVMVTSLGTGKFGWPASALNLFGGILTQKRQAEKALEASGLNFTIVRPGGMERPTDSYKKTNNVRLAEADSLFGGQVSRLQVAELITSAVINPELAEDKILEVVAETQAPKLDYEQLLKDFGTDSFVAEPEPDLEESQPVKEAPARPPRRTPTPRQKRPAPKAESQAVSGNQDALAEDISKKEIDMKLGKDAPEPSQEAKNIAEDIAKAEIRIDQGKEKPVKNWFGLGRSKAAPQEEEVQAKSPVQTPPKLLSKKVSPKPETPKSEPDPVQAPVQAAQEAVKSVAKDSMSDEDLQKFREARNKGVETRAQKEAEFLARMQADRQAEDKKQKAAREKREQESIEKARKDRDALWAKQEEQQKAFREAEAKRTADIAERVAKAKPKPAAEPVAQKQEADAGAAQQAKANAQEAKKWIEEWRSSQSGASSPTTSASTEPQAASKSASENGASPAEAAKNNAQEARKWIEEWRASK